MSTLPEHHIFTFEEYLDGEKAADYKNEFHSGQIYAMSGGTPAHCRLSVRICSLLDRQLSNCSVYGSDLNLRIEQLDKGVYPDCMVVCGDLQLWGKRNDVITNPALVAEVLSPSTEKYDQGTKVSWYQGIASLQNILLISQDRVQIDCYSRTSEVRTWTMTRYDRADDSIPVLGIEIKAEEVYRGILSF